MRQHRAPAVTLELPSETRAEHNRSCEGDHAANGVDHSGTGEVMKALSQGGKEAAGAAHGCEKAVRPPCPVADDRIDETGDGETIEKVAYEAGTANHGSGRDRGAGIREGKLEDPEGQEADPGGFIGRRYVFQEEPVVPDEPIAMAEHK